MSHARVWEYHIFQWLAVARRVVWGLRLKSPSGGHLDRLSSTLDYVHAKCAGRLSLVPAQAHGPTGHAVQRGHTCYHRAA